MKTKSLNKTGMGFLILGSILFCLFTGLAHAQENWVKTIGSGQGNAVIQGRDGYIYVAGVLGGGPGVGKFGVIKIRESTGDTMWTYKYPSTYGGEAKAICWGDTNNACIYAAGHYLLSSTYNNTEILVVKLDTHGVQKSTYTFTNANGPDSAFAICYGPGNLYVGGRTDYASGSPVDFEYTMLKLDTTIAYKGVRRLAGGTTTNDRASSIFYAGDYIYSAGGYNNGFWVFKNDTTNALADISVYYNYGAGISAAKQVVYGDGKIYAAGYLTGSGTAGTDFTVIALNQDCTVFWGPYIYNGRANNSSDCANSVVYAGSATVYAAGYSTDSTLLGRDYTVICLSGVLPSWVYRNNGPGNGNEEAGKIVVSGSYAYAAGFINLRTGGDSPNDNFMITKHDFTHSTPIWTYQYDGPGIPPAWTCDQAATIATSPLGTGNVYVVGFGCGNWWWGSGGIVIAMSLPENFPPYIPALKSPADSAWLNNFAVTFRWYKSTDPENDLPITYVLKYDTLANFATADSQVVADNDTSKTVIFTDSNAYYYWKVKAKDSGGRPSIYSAVRSFGLDLKAPNVPTLLSPIDQAVVLDTSVTFTWTSVTFKGLPAPVRYIIQVDTNTSFSAPIKLDTVDVITKLYNLKTDDWYYWQVKAFDLAGNQGSYSSYEAFGVDITNPLIDSVTILYNTELLGPFDVYAKVTDFFGVDSVVLYYQRNEDPTFFPVKMDLGVDPVWYTAHLPAVSLAWDTVKYYYWALDNTGHTSTNPDSGYYWFVANAVGIAEHQGTPVSFSFGLRNNPAQGRALFNLALPQDAFITLRLYDVSGRLIDKLIAGRKSAGYYQIPWIPKTNAGVYFYAFESPGHKEFGKLVFIR